MNVFTKLIDDKLLNGSENLTFMERLIRISDENPEFDLFEVRSEALNTLTAVRIIQDMHMLNIH